MLGVTARKPDDREGAGRPQTGEMQMNTKLSFLMGAALLGVASIANAAEPLSRTEMDAVVAGWYSARAYASASALALGPNTYTSTYTQATAIRGVGSESYSSSSAVAY